MKNRTISPSQTNGNSKIPGNLVLVLFTIIGSPVEAVWGKKNELLLHTPAKKAYLLPVTRSIQKKPS